MKSHPLIVFFMICSVITDLLGQLLISAEFSKTDCNEITDYCGKMDIKYMSFCICLKQDRFDSADMF